MRSLSTTSSHSLVRLHFKVTKQILYWNDKMDKKVNILLWTIRQFHNCKTLFPSCIVVEEASCGFFTMRVALGPTIVKFLTSNLTLGMVYRKNCSNLPIFLPTDHNWELNVGCYAMLSCAAKWCINDIQWRCCSDHQENFPRNCVHLPNTRIIVCFIMTRTTVV